MYVIPYFTYFSRIRNHTQTTCGKQEALLLQTDRATRYVSQILANCCIKSKFYYAGPTRLLSETRVGDKVSWVRADLGQVRGLCK